MLLSGAGLLLLTLLGVWLERRRDTDLQDPEAGVTAEFRDPGATSAPDLSFRDVSGELGLRMRHGPGPRTRTLPEDTGSGLAWRDYDGDGDPDLYVVNFSGPLGVEPEPSGSNRLYRNDGDRFVDVTDLAGVGDLEGFGMGARFADFDGDGDEDLYVTNYGPNRLFRSLGDGTFRDDAPELGVDDPRWSIAGAWGDLNRDGLLDLYVTNYVEYDARSGDLVSSSGDPNWQGVPFTLNPNSFDPQPNALFLQEADGGFRDAALEAGASNPEGRSLAATIVDVDGDGWLDLYVANDVSANVLLKNQGADFGAALFEDIGPGTGTADPRGSMGISVADLARDGEAPDGLPDLFVSHWVAQENALYQAVSQGGRLE
ncbi:MAG: VCBS repeat-containing protein, partial [Thermoanaerobaculia bacterium]|nr:VCBS repeat-containing protein [Thermoanaerobaculia bacterium]